MISEAKAFWDSISGKVKSLIRKETENAMRLQRYDVTTAPNGAVMGVRQPFGNNEIFLPYSQEVASATVGDTVLVAWWGSMSNAKVYFFANGYEGTAGAGLPTGGTAGQGLLKTGPDDYQAAWGNVVTSVNGQTGAVDITFEDVTVSNKALYRCSGTINGFPALKVSRDKKFIWISGRSYISSYSRSGANPGISFQTNLTPSSSVSHVVGIRGEGTEGLYPESVVLSIGTTGAASLTTSETFTNAGHSNRLIFIIPSCIIPI